MLYLEGTIDIIFYFYATLKKIKKNSSKVLNTFENIKENQAFAPPLEQMLHFPQYFQIHSKSKASKDVKVIHLKCMWTSEHSLISIPSYR